MSRRFRSRYSRIIRATRPSRRPDGSTRRRRETTHQTWLKGAGLAGIGLKALPIAVVGGAVFGAIGEMQQPIAVDKTTTAAVGGIADATGPAAIVDPQPLDLGRGHRTGRIGLWLSQMP